MTSKNGELQKRLVFSSDFNDPPLSDVLMWHIGLCAQCSARMWDKPPAFGQPSRMCAEYQEIIEEYAEYEGQYAMRGNP
jgi:hypothetical protein